ncbi:hypothetical protein P4O66_015469, partial [Electrophorus voltai]
PEEQRCALAVTETTGSLRSSQNAQPTGSKVSRPDWVHLLTVQMAALDQKQEIREIRSMVQVLGKYVHCLGTSAEQRANPTISSPVLEGIKGLIAIPEVYGGDLEACEGFTVQCELFFGYQPRVTDHVKVSFGISRFTGKARA